jgi:uncharacterized membrane protein
MPEIIPNFHPIVVHFTFAQLSLAVGLFVITPLIKGSLKEQWSVVARWTLWFGTGLAMITGLSGLYAYGTVAHDAPSHIAMTDHRNWAVATIAIFLVLALWWVARVRAAKSVGLIFVAMMVFAGVLLTSTAWRGGELVYRHGLGVMSLPQVDHHHHGKDEDHDLEGVLSPEIDLGHAGEGNGHEH